MDKDIQNLQVQLAEIDYIIEEFSCVANSINMKMEDLGNRYESDIAKLSHKLHKAEDDCANRLDKLYPEWRSIVKNVK